MESGAHSSIHPNFHHQIVFAKFNLKIFYQPPHTNVKFGITIRLILTLFVDQSMSSLVKTEFLIQMQIKKCIYLMKQLRIFFLTLYHTRQSFAMTGIHHGSRAK